MNLFRILRFRLVTKITSIRLKRVNKKVINLFSKLLTEPSPIDETKPKLMDIAKLNIDDYRLN